MWAPSGSVSITITYPRTFVVDSQIVLGQSDGVALVLGAPETGQGIVVLVHVRVEQLESIDGLGWISCCCCCCGRRCCVRYYVECQESWGCSERDGEWIS